MAKRVFVSLLALLMLATMLPVASFAVEAEAYYQAEAYAEVQTQAETVAHRGEVEAFSGTSISVSAWEQITEALALAQPGDEIFFLLQNDIIAPALATIPAGVTVTIDSDNGGHFAIYRNVGSTRHFFIGMGAVLNLHHVRLTRDVPTTIMQGVSVATTQGGGVTVGLGGTMNMFAGSVISYNFHNEAGGILVGSTATGTPHNPDFLATLNMFEGSVVENNRAAQWGGGIALRNSVQPWTPDNPHNPALFSRHPVEMNLMGGTVRNNYAQSRGGGIEINGQNAVLNLTSGAVENNVSPGAGGGVGSMGGGHVNLSGTARISGNWGGRVVGDATVTGGLGGGLFLNNSTMNMTGGVIEGNVARWNGGAIYVQGNWSQVPSNFDAVVTMSGGEIINNHSYQLAGAVMVRRYLDYIFDWQLNENTFGATAEFYMSGGRIEGNTSARSGGGIVVASVPSTEIPFGAHFTMSGDAVLANNLAGARRDGSLAPTTYPQAAHFATRSGGGVYLLMNGVFRMYDDAQVYGNWAADNGGGVYVEADGRMYMHGGTVGGDEDFHANRSPYGGGIYIWGVNNGVNNNGYVIMTGGRIAGNYAYYAPDHDRPLIVGLSGQGGGVAVGRRSFTMEDGIIENNRAGRHGGGVFVNNQSNVNPALHATYFLAEGGIIRNNHSDLYGGGIFSTAFVYAPILPAGVPMGGVSREPFYHVITSEEVEFYGNTAGRGSFAPPVNFADTSIAGTGTSPTRGPHQAHQLNNYDVNFLSVDIYKGVANGEDESGVEVGETIEYLLTITNPFDTALSGDFVVTDPLMSNFVTFTENSLSVTRGGTTLVAGTHYSYTVTAEGVVTVTFYGLPANSQSVIAFQVVTLAAADGEKVLNQANLRVPTGNDSIPYVDMPSQEVEVPVGAPPEEGVAAVEITKSVSPASVTTGGTDASRRVTYTLRIRNSGEVPLTDLVVTDSLDPRLTNSLVTTLPSGVQNNSQGQNLAFGVEDLAPGATVEIRFTAIVASNVPANTQIPNTAWVRSAAHDLEESDSATVTVRAGGGGGGGGGGWTPPTTPWRQAYLIGIAGEGYPRPIRPQGNINRAEVATIFFRLITDEARSEYWMQENPFSDVSLEQWFNNAISTTTNMGLFDGIGDDLFAPNQAITRAELAVVLVRFMERDTIGQFAIGEDFFSDISQHWARRYINVAAEMGWILGPDGLGGPFNPHDSITRAETAAMINRLFGRLPENTGDLLAGMNVWPDNQDVNAWYYLYIQSATNSYDYERKADGIHERWTALRQARDWSVLERPNSQPQDILAQ